MYPKRTVAVVLLLAVVGCTGVGPGVDNPTSETTSPTTSTTPPTTTSTSTVSTTSTAGTTPPHTGVGTSHNSRHLSVQSSVDAGAVTVTLAPDGDSAAYDLSGGKRVELTREIHARGHGVSVVVERGGEVVFNQTVHGYENYEVHVRENDTSVSVSMV